MYAGKNMFGRSICQHIPHLGLNQLIGWMVFVYTKLKIFSFQAIEISFQFRFGDELHVFRRWITEYNQKKEDKQNENKCHLEMVLMNTELGGWLTSYKTVQDFRNLPGRNLECGDGCLGQPELFELTRMSAWLSTLFPNLIVRVDWWNVYCRGFIYGRLVWIIVSKIQKKTVLQRLYRKISF